MLVEIHQKPFEVEIDDCIATEILNLNLKGVRTVNSCCGHGRSKPTAVIENNHGSLGKAVKMGYKTNPMYEDDLLFSIIELKSNCTCTESEGEK